jgi:hypothetical protein
VPVAAFRRDAPARCGVFVDERRILAGDDGGPTRMDAKRSSSPVGQCGSAEYLRKGRAVKRDRMISLFAKR